MIRWDNSTSSLLFTCDFQDKDDCNVRFCQRVISFDGIFNCNSQCAGTQASIGPKWRTRRETRSMRPTWATARKRSYFSRTQSPRQNLALLVLTSNIGNFQKVSSFTRIECKNLKRTNLCRWTEDFSSGWVENEGRQLLYVDIPKSSSRRASKNCFWTFS